MRARIYQQAKTATQSGQANTHEWILEYGQTQPRRQDPLMGWTGSRDTSAQVRLAFPDREAAVAYADRHAVPYDLELPTPRVRKPKVYADNFRYDRVQNWTH